MLGSHFAEKTISVSEEKLKELLTAGEEYRDKLLASPNNRFCSWEHCYSAFAEKRKEAKQDSVDILVLHLAGYLASWGMYRGSSFLLKQVDYLIHRPVVELLLKPQWDDLWNPSVEYLSRIENSRRVEQLAAEISRTYCEIIGREKEVSDTLATKILLGTLGCVPAYDNNFMKAVRALKCGIGVFNAASVSALAKFYEQHADAFEPLRASCSHGGIEYPPMKVLDMCFFSMGEK